MHKDGPEELEQENFGELVKFTLGGFASGLVVGAILDSLGFQRQPLGQWLVRTLSGEGESVFEGIYAIRKRIGGAAASVAEAYGWGKMVGMVFPWIIDAASRLLGVDVFAVEGFYIPYFYAMSDQMGASVAGIVFFRRGSATWTQALSRYFRHPVMLSGLAVILLVPAGLLGARLLGFVPTNQIFTALETIAANLCWVPPLVGWLAEWKQPRKG